MQITSFKYLNDFNTLFFDANKDKNKNANRYTWKKE